MALSWLQPKKPYKENTTWAGIFRFFPWISRSCPYLEFSCCYLPPQKSEFGRICHNASSRTHNKRCTAFQPLEDQELLLFISGVSGFMRLLLFFFFWVHFWKKASTICFLGREYGITVNYIEKLDSFTAVIIDLPICLGELAAGKKIKCNLSFYLFKKKQPTLIQARQQMRGRGESEFLICQS